jgi:O-antigen ligase
MFNSTVRDNGLRDTHNWYLKVLADTGLVGLGIVMWLLSAMGRTAWHALQHSDSMVRAVGLGLLLALTSLVIANLFGDRWSYVEINGVLWMLVAGARCSLDTGDAAEEQPAHSEPAYAPV